MSTCFFMIINLMILNKPWINNVMMLFMLAISITWMILNFIKTWCKISTMMNLMGMILIFFFLSDKVWKFYILFEINMIPMILIILGWGTNMARLNACFYMMMYMMMASLPTLGVIIYNWKVSSSMSMMFSNYQINTVNSLILVMMFLVKMPLFGLHYWLPKAHVEASTIGSMILASGLLKMGSYGLMKVFFWIKHNISMYWGIFGSMISSMYCFMQSDQKKLIALSSVSHMSLSFSALLISMNMSMLSFILINLTHSIISSAMFFNAGATSSLSGTRLMYWIPALNFQLMYFILMFVLFNMGIPPSYSSISELLFISSSFLMNYQSFMVMFFLIMLSCMFSMNYIMFFYKSNSSELMIKTFIFIQLSHLLLILFWFIML